MKNSKRRGAVKVLFDFSLSKYFIDATYIQVPNVILRPAQASGSNTRNTRQTSPPRVGLHEEEVKEGDLDLGVGNKPFHGIVLCATGDLDKRTLFLRAQELGAIRANDFTDQVTHLVADAPGSAKYKCAVERNLPILNATWVEECYETWLNGDIVDLERSIDNHRLLIFSGVNLCLTGMEDLAMRTKIHTLLMKQGGVYLKSLGNTATHLLCCASDNSPKITWAKDYNRTQARGGGIRLVWEEWLWDSLEFGGRWDESEYDIINPRPARKSLSQISESVYQNPSIFPAATLSQRTPLPRSIPTSSLLGDDPPEYGQTLKHRDVGLRIFSNIVQQRVCVGSDGAQKRTENYVDSTQHSQPQRAADPRKQHQEITLKPVYRENEDADTESASALTRLANHRATSFANTRESQSRQPFQRAVSHASNLAVAPQISFMGGPSTAITSSASQIFVGYTFRAFGEAQGCTLRTAIEDCGAQWLTDGEQDADFLIVRLVSGGLFWQQETDVNERAKFRTECWVERCIFEERICAPDEHVVFTPLKIDTPVEGSENLYVSLSGLDSAETCWTKRLVRAIGGNLALTFSRRSTHLLCPSRQGAKYDKAREWGVTVVDVDWLFTIATTGVILPSKKKGYEGCDVDAMTVDKDIRPRVDSKGKEKARELDDGDGAIVDITNGASQDLQFSNLAGTSLTFGHSSLNAKRLTPHCIPRSSSLSSPVFQMDLDSALPPDLGTDPGLTFGKPATLLSGPSFESTNSKLGPTPPSPQIIHTPSRSSLLTTPHSKQKALTRRFSAAEIEKDKRMTQIASSHSPSPLKIPAKATPVTSPLAISETRGLRTAITALLGKRGTEVREELDGPQKPQGRSSKRPRLPSRVTTDSEPRRGLSPALSLINTDSPPFLCLPPHEEGDIFIEEGQSSLRVIYEDPGQRAEKQKLIALFEKGSASNAQGSKSDGVQEDKGLEHTDGRSKTAPKRKLVRRTTRSSGS
ncbi:hypothetical protein K439DRAFT_1657707 [Ramaria rubella]|nr:hypothetical protein K439DRAFT_1657707 [Ramaria rubella]